MAIFNVTENMTEVTEVFRLGDSFTQGMTGIAILLVVYFGAWFITSPFSSKDSFIASSFVGLMTAIFLVFLGLLNIQFVFVTGFLFVLSIVVGSINSGGA